MSERVMTSLSQLIGKARHRLCTRHDKDLSGNKHININYSLSLSTTCTECRCRLHCRIETLYSSFLLWL